MGPDAPSKDLQVALQSTDLKRDEEAEGFDPWRKSWGVGKNVCQMNKKGTKPTVPQENSEQFLVHVFVFVDIFFGNIFRLEIGIFFGPPKNKAPLKTGLLCCYILCNSLKSTWTQTTFHSRWAPTSYKWSYNPYN